MHARDVITFAEIEREKLERTALPDSIGAMFDTAVRRHPDKPLWVSLDTGETLTYADFSKRVDLCLRMLSGWGVRPGSHVASMMPNVPALAITWIALAKLGAVVLPVNTNYVGREIRELVEAGDVEFLLVDEAYLDRVAEADASALPADRILVHGAPSADGSTWEQRLNAQDGSPIELPAIAPDDLMTIQFTSGSTGLPKGCMLPHRYWTTIAFVRSWQGPRVRRMLIDMPFHYMGGQWRFLMAVVLGATAVVALRPSIQGMIARLVEHQIDFCSVSPLLAKQPPDQLSSSLAVTWAGTMALPADSHRVLETHLNGAAVREMYGLTETGATLAMPYYADGLVGSGALGLPVPFRECRIVDPEGNDVARGSVGELWTRGPGMMLGYYKRPDATASAWAGDWFKTGDLFSQDDEGFFRIVGRIKDVIRRSGENVSATEVEYAASAMDEIEDVAAVAVPDDARGEEVKLYVVLKPGFSRNDVPPAAIRGHCERHLARFKLPRYISYVDELPKTPSGKTAKHILTAKSDLSVHSFDCIDGTWR